MQRMMYFLVIVILVVPACVIAQNYAIDKGSYMLSGTAGLTSAGGDELYGEERVTTVTIDPMIGYFFVPNLAFGSEFIYTTTTQGDNTTSCVGFGPRIAYFAGDEDSKTLPFAGVGYLYTLYSNGYEYSDTYLSFSGGAVFMLARNVGISGRIFYRMRTYKPTGGESSSVNILGFGFGINTFIF